MKNTENIPFFTILNIPDVTETERAFIYHVVTHSFNELAIPTSSINFARCFIPIGECTANWVSKVSTEHCEFEFWIVYKGSTTMGLATRVNFNGHVKSVTKYAPFNLRPACEDCDSSLIKFLPTPDSVILTKHNTNAQLSKIMSTLK